MIRVADRPGLVYLNNRHHDPTLATFISVDPLVAQTGQPYIYGAANPITFSDPSGLCVDSSSFQINWSTNDDGELVYDGWSGTAMRGPECNISDTLGGGDGGYNATGRGAYASEDEWRARTQAHVIQHGPGGPAPGWTPQDLRRGLKSLVTTPEGRRLTVSILAGVAVTASGCGAIVGCVLYGVGAGVASNVALDEVSDCVGGECLEFSPAELQGQITEGALLGGSAAVINYNLGWQLGYTRAIGASTAVRPTGLFGALNSHGARATVSAVIAQTGERVMIAWLNLIYQHAYPAAGSP